tara:strand:+ start:328 stop:654 length:327 start_codon:yes stop_codon:yes gene_type:complete
MIEFFESIWISITELGLKHNVDPVIFAVLYIASIPPYLGSLAIAIRNYRKGKSIMLPILSTAFFFILPALYVAVFGRDVAWWVYLIIALMVGYGGYNIFVKFRTRIEI